MTIGRTLDRIGHRRVLLPALVAPPLGLLFLSLAQGTVTMTFAALVFGAGFGLMYPAYTAYVMNHVAFSRRGAAFGAMLAAFDTGIGTGSSTMGWLIHEFGYRRAFAVAAGIAFLALPSFFVAERKLGYRSSLKFELRSAIATVISSHGFFAALGREAGGQCAGGAAGKTRLGAARN